MLLFNIRLKTLECVFELSGVPSDRLTFDFGGEKRERFAGDGEQRPPVRVLHCFMDPGDGVNDSCIPESSSINPSSLKSKAILMLVEPGKSFDGLAHGSAKDIVVFISNSIEINPMYLIAFVPCCRA